MNNFYFRAAALLLVLDMTTPSWAATLSLNPSQTEAKLGESFSIELRVSELGAGNALGSFDLHVNFDPQLFSFSSYSLGSQLGDLGLAEAFDISTGSQAPGRLQLGEISLLDDLSAQPQSFTLATLNFTAKAQGSGLFGLSQVTLGDAWGSELPTTLNGASVNVSAVPEPSRYLLLLAGLGLLALARRASGTV